MQKCSGPFDESWNGWVDGIVHSDDEAAAGRNVGEGLVRDILHAASSVEEKRRSVEDTYGVFVPPLRRPPLADLRMSSPRQLKRILHAVVAQGKVIEIATKIIITSIEYFVESYIKEAEGMDGFNFSALYNRQLNPAQKAEKKAFLLFCLEMFKFLLENGEARPPGCAHMEDINLHSKLLSINNYKKSVYAAEVDRRFNEMSASDDVEVGDDEEEMEIKLEEETTVDLIDDLDEGGGTSEDRSARGLSSDHYDVKLGAKGTTTERHGRYQKVYAKMLEDSPKLPRPVIYSVVDFENISPLVELEYMRRLMLGLKRFCPKRYPENLYHALVEDATGLPVNSSLLFWSITKSAEECPRVGGGLAIYGKLSKLAVLVCESGLPNQRSLYLMDRAVFRSRNWVGTSTFGRMCE